MKIELTPAVVACLKRGLNCWPQQNFADGIEIKEILKNDETEPFEPDYNTEAVLVDEMQREAEQEPVAMRYDFDGYGYKYIDRGSGSDWQTRVKDAELLYIFPWRTWVGLTDEEVKTLRYKIDVTAHWTYDKFYEAIEAKLKDKNGG